MNAKPVVFLSHSGLDARYATQLAHNLEADISGLIGDAVEVFNTSEPQYRFRDLSETLSAGEEWAAAAKVYEQKLRAYLSDKLISSAAYVLLVTAKSLEAHSSWIVFEVETAYQKSEESSHKRLFFFPCVAEGATLSQLPGKAIYFQGIELGERGSTYKLSRLIAQGMRSAPSQSASGK